MDSGIVKPVAPWVLAALAAITWIAPPTPARAANESTPASQRIEALEAENAAIREELAAQRARIEQLVERSEAAGGGSGSGGFSVTAGIPISLSGFLKADTLWNDARLNSTSAPRFALSPGAGPDTDDQFSATVQHSRLIAKLGDIVLGENARLRAHGELDLFNLSDTGDTNFNNNQLRLRQLYMELDVEDWSVLIGQAWDVFSPLNVGTLNTNGNYWFGSNAGFRRPQLRVSRSFSPADGHTLTLAGSANLNSGITVLNGGRVLNSGRDAGIPVIEGRIDYLFPGWEGSIRLGASGVWGQEELDGVAHDVEQWAVGAHAVVPITDWLSFKGEYQLGENTDAFLFGGGVNPTTGRTIGSSSAWGQLSAAATDRLTISALAGIDDPSDDDVGTGGRTRNVLLGANLKYRLYDPLTLGVEYAHFDTDYRGIEDQAANLLWLSAIFSF